jgi:hypothetical protein
MNLKICIGILASALAIAAAVWSASSIPGGHNPPIIASHILEARVDVPRNVEVILVRSCKDCHSNETRWPWYSRLPTVSGLVQDDVRRGRSHMNLSEWNRTESLGREEEHAALIGICEELRSGDMPLTRYRRMHSKSGLTQPEVETVCAWTDRAGATLKQHMNVSAHR